MAIGHGQSVVASLSWPVTIGDGRPV